MVLPRLLVTYDRHLARAVPVADGPVVRALRLVRRDELEAWAEGEALLEGALRTTADAAVVAEAQQRLEAAVVGAAVGGGLVPWPGAERAANGGGSGPARPLAVRHAVRALDAACKMRQQHVAGAEPEQLRLIGRRAPGSRWSGETAGTDHQDPIKGRLGSPWRRNA